MRFSAKEFVGEVKSLLNGGEQALDMLVDAYLWAQHHLKELHAVAPEYEQRWLRSEIRRVFNVDVVIYVRAAKRLGGGADPASFERGKVLIKKVSPFEAFRAEHLLSEEQFPRLLNMIEKDCDPESFRKVVDRLSANLQKLRDEDAPGKNLGDSNLKVMKLKAEVEVLRKENARLKAELEAAQRKLDALKGSYDKILTS